MIISGGSISSADVTDRAAREVGIIRRFWESELNNSRAFARSRRQTASVAQLAHVQLLNPAASGVVARVYGIVMASPTAQEIQIVTYDTALTDLGAGFNLVLGGAAAACHIRYADAGDTGTNILSEFAIPAGGHVWLPMYFLQLAAAKGILVRSQTTNIPLSVSYLWTESAS